MAGSRVGLFDNLNIPIHRDAQHREDLSLPKTIPRKNTHIPCQVNTDIPLSYNYTHKNNLVTALPLKEDARFVGRLGPFDLASISPRLHLASGAERQRHRLMRFVGAVRPNRWCREP